MAGLGVFRRSYGEAMSAESLFIRYQSGIWNRRVQTLKRKIIWVIDHYSSEPQYSGMSRQYDFAKELNKRGYRVIVFASGFSHYTHSYISKKRILITRPFEHVWYVDVKTFQYEKNNGKNRALNLISFMIQVLRFYPEIAKRYGKPDVVEGASVHPLAWLAAYNIAKKYNVRFIAEVRDFWPQIWIDSGEKKASDPACLFFRAVEKFIYRHADKIIYSHYHGDRYLCEERGVPREKTVQIGQVTDCERYDKNKDKINLIPPKIREFVSEGFVCGFTGYYMQYNGVYTILEAVKILQNRGIPIKMIFVGDGKEQAQMQKYVYDNRLKDTLIESRIGREAVPVLAGMCDVCISQSAHKGRPDVYRYGVSTLKINEYMYAGTCILFGFDYEDNEVVNSKAGLRYQPFDAYDLADKISLLYQMDDSERRKYGARGKHYHKMNHSVEVLTDKLLETLF